VLFLWTDGKANYLTRIMKDGSQLARVFPEPIGNIYSASPDRRWIVVGRHVPDGSARPLIAIPTGGGAARQICENPCHAAWAPDGRFFYVEIEPSSRGNPGKTLAIPVPPGEALPRLPASGIRSVEDAAALPGVRLLDGWNITRGPDLSVFAYVKTTMHRNLFRIPLSSR
jgi:hypothetical protein